MQDSLATRWSALASALRFPLHQNNLWRTMTLHNVLQPAMAPTSAQIKIYRSSSAYAGCKFLYAPAVRVSMYTTSESSMEANALAQQAAQAIAWVS